MITAAEARELSAEGESIKTDELLREEVEPAIRISAGKGERSCRIHHDEEMLRKISEALRPLGYSCEVLHDPGDGPTCHAYNYLLVEW